MGRALFAAAINVTVNNGRTASFWLSSWLNGGAPSILFPHLYSHSRRKKYSRSRRKNRVVADALDNEQWIRDVLHDLTIPLVDELVKLWGLIEDV